MTLSRNQKKLDSYIYNTVCDIAFWLLYMVTFHEHHLSEHQHSNPHKFTLVSSSIECCFVHQMYAILLFALVRYYII